MRRGPTTPERARRPAWPALLFCGLAGPILHGALLLLPLILLGGGGRAWSDAETRLFLLLASGYYLTDLPTLAHAGESALRPASADDRLARSLATLTGLSLLGTFWLALAEHDRGGSRLLPGQQGSGAALMIAGTAVRAAAVLALGRSFVTELGVDPGRPLVELGPYGRLRHPSESGNLAVALGACLLLGGRLALLLALGTVLPLVLRRVRDEERGLVAAFGDRYRAYSRRAARLVPFIY